MTGITVHLANMNGMDIQTKEKIVNLFKSNFDTASIDPANCLANYFEKVAGVLMAHRDRELVGFQFYQCKNIQGKTVHHFSLSCRIQDKSLAGLQARFGTFLIRQAITKNLPWKPIYLAGVTNTPKSYINMHNVGGRCFPDVLKPDQNNPFGAWYFDVAKALGIPAPDENGMLKDRMAQLGFDLKPIKESQHPVAQAYNQYVEHNQNHGVFTLIELVPIRDIPLYLMKKLIKVKR